ncbi:PorP/SprF family type IX secretion system membrane protein [Marinilabilia sp.]
MNQIKKEIRITTYLVALLAFLYLPKAEAQQEPQYTQYMFNTVSVNPAYAGTRNALNILLLSRLQWAGLEGAPRTYDLTVHTPLNNYKMGLGLSVISDNYGPVKNLYVNLSYSYRVNLTEKLILSMGIKGGFYNYHVGLSDLYTGESEVDPVFSKDIEQSFKPNAGFGFYLYTDNFYFGASAPKLFETDLNGEQTTTSTVEDLKRHYFFMTGAVFDLGAEVKFKPSVISRMVEGAPFSIDAAAQFLFKDRFWAGGSYRLDDAIAVLTGIQVNNQLMIGYAYDIPISDLRPFNNGSHEIVLSYDFDNFVKDKLASPRYF